MPWVGYLLSLTIPRLSSRSPSAQSCRVHLRTSLRANVKALYAHLPSRPQRRPRVWRSCRIARLGPPQAQCGSAASPGERVGGLDPAD
eukprot:scaffold1827_cov421-Prasinococcus_capsulatus_cf.AAC.42